MRLVLVAWLCLPLAACGVPTVTTSSSPAAAAPSPSTVHFSGSGIALDYPASWTLRTANVNEHYVFGIASLGTASGTYTCATPSPPSSVPSCQFAWNLGPGQLEVELESVGGSPYMIPLAQQSLDPGARRLKVAGAHAIFWPAGQPRVGVGASLAWAIADPRSPNTADYYLAAYFRGPGVERMEAQVQEIIASLRFESY